MDTLDYSRRLLEMPDTMIEVSAAPEEYIDNVNLLEWILTVLRTIFINNFHQLVREQTIVDHGVNIYTLDMTTEPDSYLPEDSFQMQEIAVAIDRLESDLRMPFSLYLSGYNSYEIADRLDLPLGTVKNRLFFAQNQMKDALKELKTMPS